MPSLEGVTRFGAVVGVSLRVIDFSQRTARETGFAPERWRGGSATTP